MNEMKAREKEFRRLTGKPSDRDIARYVYYVENGVPDKMIADPPERLWEALKKSVPEDLVRNWSQLTESLLAEINHDYRKAIKKATGWSHFTAYFSNKTLDYILLDQEERLRLFIQWTPIPYPIFVIRSPVPWHGEMEKRVKVCTYGLFVPSVMSLALNDLWYSKYADLRFVDIDAIKKIGEPMLPADFESLINQQCFATRDILRKQWIPDCAKKFVELRHHWAHLLPENRSSPLKQTRVFFSSIEALMSNQLRSIVEASVHSLTEFIEGYKSSNAFKNEYEEMHFVKKPVLLIKLKASDPKVVYSPSLREIREHLLKCFQTITNAATNLPRVETELFPAMVNQPIYIRSVNYQEDLVSKCTDRSLHVFRLNSTGPRQYLDYYRPYSNLLNNKAEMELRAFMKERHSLLSMKKKKGILQENDPLEDQLAENLSQVKKQLDAYRDLKREILGMRFTVPLQLFCLDCKGVNLNLAARAQKLRDILSNFELDEAREINRSVCRRYEAITNKLSEEPANTQALVDLQDFLKDTQNKTVFRLQAEVAESAEHLSFLLDYTFMSEDDIRMNTNVFYWPHYIKQVFDVAISRLSGLQDAAEDALRARILALEKRIAGSADYVQIMQKRETLSQDEIKKANATLDNFKTLVNEFNKEAEAITREEKLLQFEQSEFPQIFEMRKVMEPYEKLWRTAKDFEEESKAWLASPYWKVDAAAVETEITEMYKTIHRLTKILIDQPASLKVAQKLRAKIEKFLEYLPTMQVVCNPGIQQRHWERISEVVGFEVLPTSETPLYKLIDLGLEEFLPRLEEIASAAAKEHKLEVALHKMKSDWAAMRFELLPYRDTGVCILSAVDDIQVLLDDHVIKAQTMHNSPYIKPFEEEMRAWENKLVTMNEIIDVWLKVQATWLYLEPIFSSEDILAQMPEEGRKFGVVDVLWREIMAEAAKNPSCLVATAQRDMLRRLTDGNYLLEEIQKGLNDYLEKKRLFFPRFFFLSNDELLEILSETKDPLRVQPHLKKCFEGISALNFTDQQEIIGMMSSEGEMVPFVTKIYPAKAKGMVEKWLLQVEEMMVQSIRKVIADSIEAYLMTVREKWVLDWPGQVVLCGSMVHWTSDVQKAISDQKLLPQKLKCDKQIDDIVKLVRGQLTSGERLTLEALIVLDVHARDVVAELVKAQINSITAFEWLSQLRYYYSAKENHAIYVQLITAQITYACEYLGNTPRLVITPLTDRCYRTLMGAIQLNLGGAPEGPAGTGKTETSKDLAKAVAKQCVVFNCSDGLDYKAMGKFFKGLAQSGAWACFDEFNRIELEVLSVVAQQIHSIQIAIAQGLERFVFEGTELQLDPTCTIFITMNPGYAGRQELPDNLKVLFRSVAMMVPDYALIGEISLYSMGFVEAKSLSSKIVATYKLCSEQLSSQHHYDYGMRAVKSVLTAAGKLRQNCSEDEEESQLILKAIIDVNLPKFLAQDIPLFEGIISDLFPGVHLAETDYSAFMEAVEESLATRHLQPVPWYTEKILQIYEMILVRHGLMIVGDPLGGKTQAYQSLADALTQLGETGGMRDESEVHFGIINPKSITMGQLYGQFDVVSHEWSDGVLPVLYRRYALAQDDHRRWVIFDGPVDAVWIENMNTVLDDNKKLCLMSGEIIAMSKRMNMIFEPADLEQASPATVSRCGMIFMEPSQLGWRPMMNSYIAYGLPPVLNEEHRALLRDLFEWLVDPCLEFITSQCSQLLPISQLHAVKQLITLFDAHLDPMRELEARKPISEEEEAYQTGQGSYGLTEQTITLWLQGLFIFSLVWSLGSALSLDERARFDVMLRDLLSGSGTDCERPTSLKLSGKSNALPDRLTVYDFVFERKSTGSWIEWAARLATPELGRDELPQDMIVPTTETVRMSYFLDIYLSHRIPMLIVGYTGTGKSVLVNQHLVNLPKEVYIPNTLNFSARTSANLTQDIIMSRLDRRRRGVYGPPPGKQCVVFVDDLNMPAKEVYGAQPPIELLRMWIDHGHWYDLKNNSKQFLVDVLFLAAMGPPGGGRNDITSRFTRHMNVLGVNEFNDATMSRIFSIIVDKHFGRGYDSQFSRLSKIMVQATLATYKRAIAVFLPTPAKSHYVFNLRDFARVIRGVLLVPPSCMKEGDKFMRLWVHEVYRVFYDRLTLESDREKWFEIVKEALNSVFKVTIDNLLGYLRPSDGKVTDEDVRSLMFGDYMSDDQVYDEVANMQELKQRMQYFLDDYNSVTKTPMNLVLFQFAMEHVSRVARVLKQDAGHCLLIGVGGSGRHSAARLAVHMADYEYFSIEITRNYTAADWREDMKRLLLKAGLTGKPTVFLFSDGQIKIESFMEDISMLLNSGDLPNIFPADEKAEMLDKLQSIAREAGKKVESSPLTLYNYFIERVRKNLHIVLTMSPIGDAFRNRLRMFPSLINCCTIDWFQVWPEDALAMVANTSLSTIEMESSIRKSIVTMCKYFHESIRLLSERFLAELRRHNYVTPTSYLELIRTFKNLLQRKRDELSTLRNRYLSGLDKLDFASKEIGKMKEELVRLQPQLLATGAETDALLARVAKDTVEVEAQRTIVASEQLAANQQAAAAQSIKDECEADLAEALPILNDALASLDTLKQSDITLVKSMKNPPSVVKLVMEAVCIMMQEKPERKPDPATAKMIEDYWGVSLKLLGDLKFLEKLKTYNIDAIPPQAIKRIREVYIPNRDFNPKIVRNASTACEGLCKWIIALDKYDVVSKVVAPKKARLAIAERELEAQNQMLAEKKASLEAVEAKMATLQAELDVTQKKKQDLVNLIELCGKKLERATQLISGLGGEKSRWTEAAKQLKERYYNITGDVLLGAGVVAYLGAFTVDYRSSVTTTWHQMTLDLKIPCSETFRIAETLGNAVTIHEWNIAGLPVDNFSTDNGIIVSNSNRWSLCIDPQGQANKWIRNMEKDKNIHVIRMTDVNYMRTLENAIQFGWPVLLENVGESLDPVLEPILQKLIFRQSGSDYIRLGEDVLEYNNDFKFYITTRLRNPHYVPEISVKVCLINFMITPIGLTDQLLSIVAAMEKPELEATKNQVILESAENIRTLKELEDKILVVLSASEGNILEDETAINILSSSKTLSEEIQVKQEVAEKTQVEIDATRSGYIPVANHGAILFFCIADLGNIDPMYQYSLAWFFNLFIMSIKSSELSDDLETRIKNLNENFTKVIYRNVCRSLFERTKLLFSLIMCVALMKARGEVEDIYWRFFLTGGVALENPHPNPAPAWLSEKSWSEIVRASDLPTLEGLMKSVKSDPNRWKAVYDSPAPHEAAFPAPFEKIPDMCRLILVRCLRSDKVIPAVQDFIERHMGRQFLEPPAFDLAGSYEDSNCCTPLIFVLSPGADPLNALMRFGADRGIRPTDIQTISLGQGQGPLAERLINTGITEGAWVVLQNCHLAASWMPYLEKICNEVIVPEKTHTDFRLWLTSYPSEDFPVSILQNGIKMTNEPPKGLRSNLLRSYSTDPISDMSFWNNCNKPQVWHKMVYGLCFFHALVQERVKYGSLGWNIAYQFNDSDLRISVRQLQMFLNDYDDLPLDALKYLTGECNYGGRVTDGNDRRCLVSLLNIFYNHDLVTQDNYSLSPSGLYTVPPEGNYESYLEFIRTLPSLPSPEVYGLHDNADITKDNQETTQLFDAILLTLPRESGGGKKSAETTVSDLALDILNKLPAEDFDLYTVMKRYPVVYTESMNTVLRQELIRFNTLTAVVRSSLQSLLRAIEGLVVMSAELEEVYASMVVGKVPAVWAAKSYPSLKPLGSYVVDLLARLNFFNEWITFDSPPVFWISGFYFTQSFLTGVLQNFARKYTIPIDMVGFDFEVKRVYITSVLEPPATSGHAEAAESNEEAAREQAQPNTAFGEPQRRNTFHGLTKPDNGAFITGLFMDGARWDSEAGVVVESKTKVLFDAMPVIWLVPKRLEEVVTEAKYSCPVYKTSVRRGVLSTTGHSTNFVLSILLPTDVPEAHWINRGVAALCQLDD
ncbi:dynein heavy chain [Echinococcus multilocularis]|uniref:Dynein heavy chain n=1 Tax=Echinococcus multilocularis TaxID=6211 RepID=A0A068Y5P9_ECHMU|nr:dynein heavy chain [Echinococcus multilocularis]